MIAILITTFLRDNLLYKTLQTITDNLPENCIVLIADQGYADEEKDITIDYYKSQIPLELYKLPFDSGLSAARNFLVNKANEMKIPYILMGADSIQFTQKYDFNPIIKFLEQDNKRGIVGFDLDGSKAPWEFDMELTPKGIKLTSSSNYTEFEGIKYKKVDICRNIFLAKTETMLNLYDNELKLCVQRDMPIILKSNKNEIRVIAIKNLFYPSISHQNYYKFDEKTNYNIWTEDGWKKLIAISKNNIFKKLLIISTPSGFIKLTENHEVIIKNRKIQAKNLKIGDNIELCKYPKLENSLNVNPQIAWLYGFFLAEGTCKPLDNPRIEFTNQNIKLLKKCESILNSIGIECAWYINKNRKDKCTFLRIKKPNLLIGIFKEFYYYNDKIIPYFIYKFNLNGRINFINGFYEGDGIKNPNPPIQLCQKSPSILNGIIYLSQDIYKNWSIRKAKNKYGEWFRLNLKNCHKINNANIITDISSELINEEVYDIETENHNFNCGIGNINIHNCEHEDSFITYKNKGYEVYWTDYLSFKRISTNTSEEYQSYRKRLSDYQKIFKQKYNMSGWVVYSKEAMKEIAEYKKEHNIT